MLFFNKKPLSFDEHSVGRQLRQAREEHKMSLEIVSKKLAIQPKYLAALESGDRRQLPQGVYARNFLREYARFLGLDYKSLLRQFLEEDRFNPVSEEKVFERRIVPKIDLLSVPILTRNIIIGIIAAVCLIYLGFLLKNIFSPPSLVLTEPAIDKTVFERQLKIAGQTEPEANVTINNQTIQVATDGSFYEEVYLERGLNTITVKAQKKYGQPAILNRYILFEE